MNIFGNIDKKTILAFLFMVVLLIVFLFYSLSNKRSDSGEITTLPISPLDAKLGRELLAALAKLKSTKLDKTIFDDPVFNSLKDFGVEIAPQPIGRRNPFASFEETADTKGGSSTKPKATESASSKPTSAPKAPVSDGFDIE
ncbi:MAG TPA: hypothetical protein DEF00_03500 [Candidatus Taylorbacteria bacterium]|nr:MAG: hypothetical protein UY03_C0043G0005 [Parcubacteria group bacterium GW2011_GWA2_47_64]KKU96893.1 MAG: hypothetical protein UY29_C0005G0026 [Parcubacteria group bacterium GW2011_GWC2_48_17]HBV01429.1 hypothetical protein [Candidatus Taylorbacteria bacterium]